MLREANAGCMLQACTRSIEPCNAATWLGYDITWPVSDIGNCYLKLIEEPCNVPQEAEVFPSAYFLMAQTPGCAPSKPLPCAAVPATCDGKPVKLLIV